MDGNLVYSYKHVREIIDSLEKAAENVTDIVDRPDDPDDTAEEEDIDEDGDDAGHGEEIDALAGVHPTVVVLILQPAEAGLDLSLVLHYF